MRPAAECPALEEQRGPRTKFGRARELGAHSAATALLGNGPGNGDTSVALLQYKTAYRTYALYDDSKAKQRQRGNTLYFNRRGAALREGGQVMK